ncbi:MAG: DUF1566 domain-containing protein [Candidatus Rokuibacteriota bacterium]
MIGSDLVEVKAFQNWDKQIDDVTRFKVLNQFNSEAVLDKETGLVWEKSPQSALRSWPLAAADCYDKKVGGRMGWRLPAIEELLSLVDPSATASPALPPGHPFTNVQFDDVGDVTVAYWSATTLATFDTFTSSGVPPFHTHAWQVRFNATVDGNPVDIGPAVELKSASFNLWCVRGGKGLDGVGTPPPNP